MHHKIKIFLYLTILFCENNFFPSLLPIELQKSIISHFLLISASEKHFKKYNERDDEVLVFPSTGSFVWVKDLGRSTNNHSLLRNLKNGETVLPHAQLWFNSLRFRIDNDLVPTTASNFANSLGVWKYEHIFFDAHAHYGLAVLLTYRKDNLRITMRDLLYKEPAFIIDSYVSSDQLEPLSLCCHNCGDMPEYSLFTRNFSNKSSIQLRIHTLTRLLFNTFFRRSERVIPIPASFSAVKRHEFIGKDTFVLLAQNQLYFMGLNSKNQAPFFFKQKFYRLQVQEAPNEEKSELVKVYYPIISFAVNQDDNKRLANGSARFVAILVYSCLNSGFENKVFLIDLRDPTNTAKTIWSRCENFYYNRISFIRNVISLWRDDLLDPHAVEILLLKNWARVCDGRLYASKICAMAGRELELASVEFEKESAKSNEINSLISEQKSVPQQGGIEDLGSLLLPKKLNYGIPLYSRRAFYWCIRLFVFASPFILAGMYLKGHYYSTG